MERFSSMEMNSNRSINNRLLKPKYFMVIALTNIVRLSHRMLMENYVR